MTSLSGSETPTQTVRWAGRRCVCVWSSKVPFKEKTTGMKLKGINPKGLSMIKTLLCLYSTPQNFTHERDWHSLWAAAWQPIGG